jgi:uroporphyrin-III C-methyltransferase
MVIVTDCIYRMELRDALGDVSAGLPTLDPGHVWLVGAGPGDPGLLTLHALAAIRQAEIIVHDSLIDERILALAGRGTRRELAGKRGGEPSADQSDISRRLVELARGRHRVVRLKGGDPFIFGRGGEEAMTLAAEGIPFRVVPGVTAGLAGLAAASIPTTLRGTNQAVILATGHGVDQPGGPDWAALARTGQPLVLYMAMQNLDRIAQALIRGGLDARTPAAVVMWATTAAERILVSTLGHVAAEAGSQGFGAPAIVAIGAIVGARDQLLPLVAGAAEQLVE